MDLVDGLDSPQVVDSRVNTNLVEADQSGVLELLVEGGHGGVDVGGGDDVRLLVEGGLHDTGVVGVRDERDDDIVSLDGLSEGIGGADINGHGGGVGETGAELLSGSVGSARNSKLVVVSGDVFGGGAGNETGTEEEDLLLGGLSAGDLVLGERLGEEVDAVVEHGSAELGEGEEGTLVDVRVVVSALGDGPERGRDVSAGLLGADHDTDLSTGVLS